MTLYIESDSPFINVTAPCASLVDARRIVLSHITAGLRRFTAELVDGLGAVVARYESGRGWTGA